MPQILWFRRDLRLDDNPALMVACESADRVLPVFVLDPALLDAGRVGSGPIDRMLASLAALQEQTGGALVIRSGDPAEVIASLADEVGADRVHVSAETTPYGRRRDDRVARALGDVELVETGSPYAIGPGRVLTGKGTPYQVFTPYSKAWAQEVAGLPGPAPAIEDPAWLTGVDSEPLPDHEADPTAGEQAARERWADYLDGDLADYGDGRDRPDLDVTSRMSIPLKYGEIHPRTMLADLAARADGADPGVRTAIDKFRTELAWREYSADVLWHQPQTVGHDLHEGLSVLYDEQTDPDLLQAWRSGRTGYPLVDAGMRQLLAEGWMHGRVRMVTASFLVKDLLAWWGHGAAHFREHLRDGDTASNTHNWQWVAGTGTDAAPYFRIFNPVSQGVKFDPSGEYVRRWVPELRHLDGKRAHEPWRYDDGYSDGYPERIVDHAEQRDEAMSRYRLTRQPG